MNTLRRTMQIVLATVAVLAAVGAVFQYVNRGGGIIGPHVFAVPESGPVGLRPFLEIRGYPADRDVSVYLCVGATSDLGDCIELAKGKPSARLRSKPIPATLPDSTDVAPGDYVLRVGPDAQGRVVERGRFTVVAFTVGEKLQARSYAGVDPTSLRAGEPKQIARGAPCRPPIYLPDGRLAVGSTVVDPDTGATVEFGDQGTELAWAPTGDKLAIITTDRKEIRIAGTDGADQATKVRESGGLLSSLSWASDGERLAYISENDPASPARFGPGPPTVQILNVESGEKTPAGPGLAVAWSPRQEMLAVERAGGNIEASNLQGGRNPLTAGRRPTWSADGNLLGVVREAEGGVQQGWVVQAADGSKAAPLAGDGVCAVSFSPSGSNIAVVRDQEGQTTLLVREIEAPE